MRLRGPGGWIVWIVAAGALSACSRTNPATPATYTLSGRVRLGSTLRNADGDSLDVLAIDDADSVRVYLYQGASLKDSTRTVGGGYRFRGLGSGSYAAVTNLGGGWGDTVSVAGLNSDTVLDTLVLSSSASLIAFPNPFGSSTVLQFPLRADAFTDMVVLRPGGLRLGTLIHQLLPAGYHRYTWDGTVGGAGPVPPGPYWILQQAGAESRARLVIKS